MSNEQALLDCPFGWGKTCHLSASSLEIGGKTYQLKELTAIRPTYRTILGVSSARIELYFGLQHLVLRGIPDQETARLMVARLQPYCATGSGALRVGLRTGRARSVAREQARMWERSTKLPVLPELPVGEASARQSAPPLPQAPSGQAVAAAEPPARWEVAPAGHVYANPFASMPDPLLVARDDGWSLARTRPLRTPRFQPPLRSVHLVPPGQKGQDTCSLPVPAVRARALPVIHVPVRLQPGECAHYSIGASLCSDRISGSDRAPYPPLDHGLLILTNRRIFYISKRSQLILAYTHLWYVSLLHTAIALHIEQQFRRIIIELEHPQEWASRIEQLSFLARHARPRADLPTLVLASVSSRSSSPLDAITLKRPILKAPRSEPCGQSAGQIPGLASPPTQIEGASQKVAATLLPEQKVSAQQQASCQPASFAAAGATLPWPMAGANVRTQDLPRTGELAEAVTQEHTPARDMEDSPARALHQLASDGEVTTSDLVDSGSEQEHTHGDRVPLLTKTTEDLPGPGVQTIVLSNRRPSAHPVPAVPALPDIEATPRCLSRTRELRRPSRQVLQ
jgi:hypothetical protein